MNHTDMLKTKKTGAGLDAMAAMLPHIDAILSDPEYRRIKDRIKEEKSMTLVELSSQVFPVIAVKNRPALYGIVSAVTGKTPEEIDAQPLDETLAVFEGALGSDILGFFGYCARLAARM